MKILVTGAGGMLANAVVAYATYTGNQVHSFSHEAMPIETLSDVRGGLMTVSPDVVINCAGRTRGFVQEMMLSNALGPHVLAEACSSVGLRMIHVSTDCVFSGVPSGDQTRRYAVEDDPAPKTPYGRAKLAGEPMLPNVLVIRTSFVGRQSGLGAWMLSQDTGASIDGWDNAFWNGTSVDAVAQLLVNEAVSGSTVGLHHAVSNEKVSKYWLVNTLAEIWQLRLAVRRVESPEIDRALRPTMELPPLKEALEMMR